MYPVDLPPSLHPKGNGYQNIFRRYPESVRMTFENIIWHQASIPQYLIKPYLTVYLNWGGIQIYENG